MRQRFRRARRRPPPSALREKPRRALGTVVEIVIIVAAAFAIAMLVQLFLVKPFTIPSVSMEPTLMVGDRVLVSRLTYHFRDPKRGDVVVFRSPVRRRRESHQTDRGGGRRHGRR